jgi:hypothetical protein
MQLHESHAKLNVILDGVVDLVHVLVLSFDNASVIKHKFAN